MTINKTPIAYNWQYTVGNVFYVDLSELHEVFKAVNELRKREIYKKMFDITMEYWKSSSGGELGIVLYKEAPKRTGNLAKSGHITKVKDGAWEIWYDCGYSLFVYHGMPRTQHREPNHWIDRAIEKTYPKVVDYLEKKWTGAIWSALNKGKVIERLGGQ